MGQITWALNYWTVSPVAGGAFLLLVFYFVTGVSREHLWGRLTRRTVFEYATVALAGVAVITRYIDWLQ